MRRNRRKHFGWILRVGQGWKIQIDSADNGGVSSNEFESFYTCQRILVDAGILKARQSKIST
jgi:hypothetical protein